MIAALAHASLWLAPALALACVLLLGRYPGEAALGRLRSRQRRAAAPALHLAALPALRAVSLEPLACSAAGRAPPC